VKFADSKRRRRSIIARPRWQRTPGNEPGATRKHGVAAVSDRAAPATIEKSMSIKMIANGTALFVGAVRWNDALATRTVLRRLHPMPRARPVHQTERSIASGCVPRFGETRNDDRREAASQPVESCDCGRGGASGFADGGMRRQIFLRLKAFELAQNVGHIQPADELSLTLHHKACRNVKLMRQRPVKRSSPSASDSTPWNASRAGPPQTAMSPLSNLMR